MKRIILFIMNVALLASCVNNEATNGENTTGGNEVAAKDTTVTVVDTAAVARAEQESLNAMPEYNDLLKRVEDENKNYPTELMPGLQLIRNYVQGHDLFYLYFINEQDIDFDEIIGERDEMRQGMAESIRGAVNEKGNPMGDIVRLCVKCDVNVNYVFKGTVSRRTLSFRYTSAELAELCT